VLELWLRHAAGALNIFVGLNSSFYLQSRLVGHRAGSDQPKRHQTGKPGVVVYIDLAPRHIPDMGGVGRHQFELAIRQKVPDRLPVNDCRLHGDSRDTLGKACGGSAE
jgi:hypothetical protein